VTVIGEGFTGRQAATPKARLATAVAIAAPRAHRMLPIFHPRKSRNPSNIIETVVSVKVLPRLSRPEALRAGSP
jgi:hypothetical protein